MEVRSMSLFTTFSLLLAVACVIPGTAKLGGHPRMRASAARFSIARERYRLIGVAEMAAAVGVLAGLQWRPPGRLAAARLAVLLLGAIYTHVRAGDSARELMPAALALLLGVLYLAVGLQI
jgi:uncharacterized membrane protein YphA (DoxX/SURF4 family)